MENYAIVKILGKQYKVSEGMTVKVDLLNQEPGSKLESQEVLMTKVAGKYTFGAPLLKGASVKATVEANDREAKILVFKYLRKNRSKKLNGHRQHFSLIKIDSIHA